MKKRLFIAALMLVVICGMLPAVIKNLLCYTAGGSLFFDYYGTDDTLGMAASYTVVVDLKSKKAEKLTIADYYSPHFVSNCSENEYFCIAYDKSKQIFLIFADKNNAAKNAMPLESEPLGVTCCQNGVLLFFNGENGADLYFADEDLLGLEKITDHIATEISWSPTFYYVIASENSVVYPKVIADEISWCVFDMTERTETVLWTGSDVCVDFVDADTVLNYNIDKKNAYTYNIHTGETKRSYFLPWFHFSEFKGQIMPGTVSSNKKYCLTCLYDGSVVTGTCNLVLLSLKTGLCVRLENFFDCFPSGYAVAELERIYFYNG